MNSGIYKITTPSGKIYVGSAVDFNKRWSKHLRQMRNGSHPNPKLLAAFGKYGEDQLKFEVILICSLADLLTYEQLVLDSLVPEYNIAVSARSPMLGRSHTEQTKKAMSAARKGKKRSQESIAEQSRSCGSCGFMGVHFSKSTNYWHAIVTVDGKRRFVGLYETAELAGAAIAEAKASQDFELWDQNRKLSARKPQRNNRSGYRGVTWDKSKGKWAAQIKLAGKNHHLGRYETPELAHAARKEAEARLFPQMKHSRQL